MVSLTKESSVLQSDVRDARIETSRKKNYMEGQWSVIIR